MVDQRRILQGHAFRASRELCSPGRRNAAVSMLSRSRSCLNAVRARLLPDAESIGRRQIDKANPKRALE
jgi:hypothetical protein